MVFNGCLSGVKEVLKLVLLSGALFGMFLVGSNIFAIWWCKNI